MGVGCWGSSRSRGWAGEVGKQDQAGSRARKSLQVVNQEAEGLNLEAETGGEGVRLRERAQTGPG